MALYGNMIGGVAPLKTLKLIDESGVEIVGVVTDSEVIFTATDNDVREGFVYASDGGVSTGTKDIPAYRTTAGYTTVLPTEDFVISSLFQSDRYNYTELQCIITVFNTNINDSVSAEKVVINNSVYNVGDTTKFSDVIKDMSAKLINLNITNDSENIYLIRYFTYKEEL